MPIRRHSLKHPRLIAFLSQNGLCHYCGQPMWLSNQETFAGQYGLSAKQAKLLMCTGEHLLPHKDGGGACKQNIVAACLYCNTRRHKRTFDLSPEDYRRKVQKQMTKGKWHPARTDCHAKNLAP